MTSQHDDIMGAGVAGVHAAMFERLSVVDYIDPDGVTTADLDAAVGNIQNRTDEFNGILFEQVRTVTIRKTVLPSVAIYSTFVIDGQNWGVRTITSDTPTFVIAECVNDGVNEIRGKQLRDM